MVFRVAGTGSGAISSYQGYYGSFYSTQDQSDGVDTPTPLTVNNTAEQVGVTIANDGSARPSRITFAYAGTYNIQFSAQLHNTGGGGSGQTVNIWFRLNGVDIPNSDTKVTVNTNNPYFVAAWNFIQTVSATNYIEIMFKTDNANIVFEYEAATANSPAIPSVIITAQQIR
jgi:hypothetical protein